MNETNKKKGEPFGAQVPEKKNLFAPYKGGINSSPKTAPKSPGLGQKPRLKGLEKELGAILAPIPEKDTGLLSSAISLHNRIERLERSKEEMEVALSKLVGRLSETEFNRYAKATE